MLTLSLKSHKLGAFGLNVSIYLLIRKEDYERSHRDNQSYSRVDGVNIDSRHWRAKVILGDSASPSLASAEYF